MSVIMPVYDRYDVGDLVQITSAIHLPSLGFVMKVIEYDSLAMPHRYIVHLFQDDQKVTALPKHMKLVSKTKRG